jgi:hypothetical protein
MSAQECLQRHPLSFLYVSFTDHSKKDFLLCISFFSNCVLYISFSIHQRSILGMHFAPFYTDINIWNEAVESSDWSLYFLKVPGHLHHVARKHDNLEHTSPPWPGTTAMAWRSRARSLLLLRSTIPRSPPAPYPTRVLTQLPLPRSFSRFLFSPDPIPDAYFSAAAVPFPEAFSFSTEVSQDGTAAGRTT